MRIEPEVAGVNIVVVGNFNPAIFTPAWFVLYDLLPEHAVDNAKLDVALPQFAKFGFEWFDLNVTNNRFQVSTLQAPYIRIRDLVVRVFTEHLNHTPMTAFGINRDVHFRVKNRAERDRIGKMLAPVEPWGEWGESLNMDGMVSLKIRWSEKKESAGKNYTDITVEPSGRMGGGATGIYVGLNDHYEFEAEKESAPLMQLLSDRFEDSIRRSDRIIDQVMSLSANMEN